MARLERDREMPARVPDSPAPSVPRSARVALAALVAIAVLAPWALGAVTPPATRVVSILAAGTAAAIALHQAARGGVCLPSTPWWPIAVFVGAGVVQLLPLPPTLHTLMAPGSAAVWHPAAAQAAALLGDGWRPISIHPQATRDWLALTGGLVALTLLAAPALGQRTPLVRTAWIVVAAGTALAVYAVVARTLWPSLVYGRIAVPTVAPFGPFVNKNHFAGWVAMAAVAALGIGRGLSRQAAGGRETAEPRTTALALAAFAAALAMGMAVLLSLSRGGTLGLVCGLAVFAVADLTTSRRPHPVARVLVPLGIAAFLGGLAVLMPGDVHDRLSRWQGDEATSFRLDVWKDASSAWWSSPLLGSGLGAFGDILPRFKTTAGAFRVEHPEDEPLELAVEGGLVALGAAGVSMALVLGRTIGAIRGHRDRLLRGIVTGALGGVAALLVHGLVDFDLRLPSNAALFLLLLSMVSAPLGAVRHSHRPWVPLVALAPILAAAVWTLTPSGPGLGQARAAAMKASAVRDPAGAKLRLEQAERAARAYVALRPADPEGWLLAAWSAADAGRAAEGAALARYAVMLDPARESLRVAARGLGGE